MSEYVNYNPDVLSCLANLSNDEVFTPPEIANAMLDMLPQELFEDPNAKFLDPACKTGVFLREIAKRLLKGLEKKIPNLQERIDHIFHEQLYAIAITELTALMSRRSVYCTKAADSVYSVTPFENKDGNIRFQRTEHTWDSKGKDAKCIYCGASREQFDRGSELETHAYEFIHAKDIYKMKFDLIISNPPYQLNDGGGMGSSAKPIYQFFVQQALKLKPRYMTMIIPSRWFSGGRPELKDFREKMLHDKCIQELHDYPNASDCFPGVEIKGGVCYFLWNRTYSGTCNICTHSGNTIVTRQKRPLLEPGMNTFIRYNEMIPIIRKVNAFNERKFDTLISANDPFGFDVRQEGTMYRVKPSFSLKKDTTNNIAFYYNQWRKNGIGYVNKSQIRRNLDLTTKIKVFIPKAWGNGDFCSDYLKPFIPEKNSCCTETYLAVGPFATIEEANNVVDYIGTKFFHILVACLKITQNTMQDAYSMIPLQDFSRKWTDEDLYKKYCFTKEEIDFIEQIHSSDSLGED